MLLSPAKLPQQRKENTLGVIEFLSAQPPHTSPVMPLTMHFEPGNTNLDAEERRILGSYLCIVHEALGCSICQLRVAAGQGICNLLLHIGRHHVKGEEVLIHVALLCQAVCHLLIKSRLLSLQNVPICSKEERLTMADTQICVVRDVPQLYPSTVPSSLA